MFCTCDTVTGDKFPGVVLPGAKGFRRDVVRGVNLFADMHWQGNFASKISAFMTKNKKVAKEEDKVPDGIEVKFDAAINLREDQVGGAIVTR